jgi:hypothetical protein
MGRTRSRVYGVSMALFSAVILAAALAVNQTSVRAAPAQSGCTFNVICVPTPPPVIEVWCFVVDLCSYPVRDCDQCVNNLEWCNYQCDEYFRQGIIGVQENIRCNSACRAAFRTCMRNCGT